MHFEEARVYQASLRNTKQFWHEEANRVLTWFRPWEQVCIGDFQNQPLQWFVKGQLNACYNCLDRHLPTRGEQIALIWEGSDPSETQQFTYFSLHQEVCRFANVLRNKGVVKGDRVGIYLPMIPQLLIAMLACARIGAVHSVIFSGFSADALALRLQDTQAKVLISADESLRGDKSISLKKNVDEALSTCPLIEHLLLVRRTGGDISWVPGRDSWLHDLMAVADFDCPPEPMDANDPLFILYTSGSTGKPKGIVHSTGGYMVYVASTYQQLFEPREGDVLFCTADPGWITGHSYLVYGPLANGTSTILYEGRPDYPTYARYWQIIERYQATIFYTSPTALRLLRAAGDEFLHQAKRNSLRLLGSVGEPIGGQVWLWFHQAVGGGRCPILNTWWQTESGGILISTLPGQSTTLPGAAGYPLLGIEIAIVDEEGQLIRDQRPGRLLINHPWPGLMQGIYGDPQRFIDNYLKPCPGYYLSGDEAYRDAAANLIIIGRNDDVIKVSGHRLGSEELESALMTHPDVAEAAIVGMPHAVKGECIVAFVTLMPSVEAREALRQALKTHIRNKIGPIATPEHIFWAPGLPKTRSGKIMRRILRKITKHEFEDIGDTSTLINPEVVQELIKKWQTHSK